MNIFQIKTKPHGHDRLNEFLDKNFICIGWPEIGDLTNLDKYEIRDRLEKTYGLSAHKLGNALGQVNTFVNTLKKDDLIFIVEKQWAHVGIVGNYEYKKQFDNKIDGMCHTRNIEWKNKILINNLNIDIQKLLNNRNTICQYHGTIKSSELDTYINEKPVTNRSSEKLDELFLNALEILEIELKSKDPERRIKAATELLRLKNNF